MESNEISSNGARNGALEQKTEAGDHVDEMIVQQMAIPVGSDEEDVTYLLRVAYNARVNSS